MHARTCVNFQTSFTTITEPCLQPPTPPPLPSAGLPMWGAWCKTLVGGFSLGEWEPLCPRPTLPEAACNTAGGLGGAVSPPAGSGGERILGIMYIKFASCAKKNPLWGAPNCGGPGAAAPFAPLLIRHCLYPTIFYPLPLPSAAHRTYFTCTEPDSPVLLTSLTRKPP